MLISNGIEAYAKVLFQFDRQLYQSWVQPNNYPFLFISHIQYSCKGEQNKFYTVTPV